MKILALVLIVLGLFKLLLTLDLEVFDLYPLSYAYRLDPDRVYKLGVYTFLVSDKVYKQLCCFLIGDGLVSIVGGLFLMFLI